MPWQSGMLSGATNDEYEGFLIGPSRIPPSGIGLSSTTTATPFFAQVSITFFIVAR